MAHHFHHIPLTNVGVESVILHGIGVARKLAERKDFNAAEYVETGLLVLLARGVAQGLSLVSASAALVKLLDDERPREFG